MIETEIVQKLKERYAAVHPLIFSRSVERAKSPGDLFDILESLPADLPVVWSDDSRRWVTIDDLYQASKFDVAWKP